MYIEDISNKIPLMGRISLMFSHLIIAFNSFFSYSLDGKLG